MIEQPKLNSVKLGQLTPSYFEAIYHIWYRSFLHFKKNWLVAAFWLFLEPILVFFGVGYGVGNFVGSIQGESYAEFFLPGMICITIMMVAFFDAAYGQYTKIKIYQSYRLFLLSPVSVRQVVLGEMLWITTKSMMSGLAVMLIGSMFGLIQNFTFLLSIPIMIVMAWNFSVFGLWVATFVRSFEEMIYPISGIIVPMSLFCSTYFPIQSLHIFFRWIVYALPLTYGVESLRTLKSEQPAWWFVGLSFILLVLGGAFLTSHCIKRIHKMLIG